MKCGRTNDTCNYEFSAEANGFLNKKKNYFFSSLFATLGNVTTQKIFFAVFMFMMVEILGALNGENATTKFVFCPQSFHQIYFQFCPLVYSLYVV